MTIPHVISTREELKRQGLGFVPSPAVGCDVSPFPDVTDNPELRLRICNDLQLQCLGAFVDSQTPPASGWLDEWGRLKGGCPGCSVVALSHGERRPTKTTHPTRFPARLFAWPQVEGGGSLRLNVLISEENC